MRCQILVSVLVLTIAINVGFMPQVSASRVSFSSPTDFTQRVYRALVNTGLSSNSAMLLTAHMALSTGFGQSVHGYNFAGVKAGPSSVCTEGATPAYKGSYACLWGFEYVGGKRVDKLMPYRVYTGLSSGVRAVLGILKAKRYVKAYKYLLEANTEYFAQVGRDGWYTAPIGRTTTNMLTHLKRVEGYLGQKYTGTYAGWGLTGLGLRIGVLWVGWEIVKRWRG